MANFFTRLFQKQSQARTALAFNQVGQPQQTPRNYEAFSKEGYQVNVIAFKCVSILSRAASSVKWNLFTKPRTGMSEPVEIETHPLLDLLKKPNPMQGQSSFFESVVAYYLIAGNSYIESVGTSPNAAPTELWSIRPDRVRIIPGQYGLPQSYEFKSQSKTILFPVDQVTGESQILHLKTFHPTDNWYGMSAIESALYSIDQHNESGKWNTSLLQNMATPSGVVTIKQDASNPMGVLPDTQFENVKDQIREKLEGSKNAGRVLLLEGGMDWKQMGLTPLEMDWIEGRKMASRDIALAFGVPPIILNIPGDSTFNNYREARLSLYEDTVLPIMDFLKTELNKWLTPRFGEGIELSYDVDSIPALDQKRTEKFTLVSSSGFLTINEKRAAVGYAPVENGDLLFVNSGQIPLSDYLEVEDTEQPSNDNPQQTEATQQENNESTDENDEDTEDTQDELVEKYHENNLIELKQINPLGRKDKVSVWRKINRERDKLSQSFYYDLKEEFDSMADRIGDSVKGIEPRLMEYAALKAVSDSSPKFKTIFLKHISRMLDLFGAPILESGKSHVDFETKTVKRFNDYRKTFAEKHSADLVTQIEGTNMKIARRKIKDIISASIDSPDTLQDIASDLTKSIKALSTSRAELIARTETSIASNNGALEAAKALDLPNLKKEWVSVNDDRTRNGDSKGEADHVSMNEVAIGLEEKFLVQIEGYSPVEMKGPGDEDGGPENVCNCRCIMVFERG